MHSIIVVFVFGVAFLSTSSNAIMGTNSKLTLRYNPSYYIAKFETYLLRFALSFPDAAEFAHRLETYSANLDFIEKYNSNPNNTAVLGETLWTHYTNAEFKAMREAHGYIPATQPVRERARNLRASEIRTLARRPTSRPSNIPSKMPTTSPSFSPSVTPSSLAPTFTPSLLPTASPSVSPSVAPSAAPLAPSRAPTAVPSLGPSCTPSLYPTASPSVTPSVAPSAAPLAPSRAPTAVPSLGPTCTPSLYPTASPTVSPSVAPSAAPLAPSRAPTAVPSLGPSVSPTTSPSVSPSVAPLVFTISPTNVPFVATSVPSWFPTSAPSGTPSFRPTAVPSASPSTSPSQAPSSTQPVIFPSSIPTRSPSIAPSSPTQKPSVYPTSPSFTPSRQPSFEPSIQPTLRPTAAPSTMSPTSVPLDWDWTTQKVNGAPVVGPIKDQGSCGSCWAFAAVGALESAYTIKYGVHNIYSEQEVVSCDTAQSGCSGGNEDSVYNWVASNGGLALESAYPYTSGTPLPSNNYYGVTGTCITSGYTKDATMKPKATKKVTTGSTSALKAAVAQQPVAVAIDGSSQVFQMYVSGVITSGCGTTIDHSVVVVGYNSTAKIPYFKIRNSWGASWGMGGYAYIGSSQSANNCQILNDISYPTF